MVSMMCCMSLAIWVDVLLASWRAACTSSSVSGAAGGGI